MEIMSEQSTDTDVRTSPPVPWRPNALLAAVAGIVITGAALGVAELLAAIGGRIDLTGQFASPLGALGAGFITLTPEWLKEFAIRTFGESDKIALQVGMGLTVLVLAVVIGLVARRSPRLAAGILLALVAVCLIAIVTRPVAFGWTDLLPTVLGGAVGVVVLGLIFRRTAVPEATRTTDDDVSTTRPATATADRRQFLRLVTLTAVGAAVTAAASRFLPSAADVERSRAGLVLPRASVQSFPDGLDLASAELGVEGQPPFITPNDDFYRIDTALVLPTVTAEEWQLKIHGLVDREISLDYADLVNRPQVERVVTLTCVSNEVGGTLAGTATWTGTLLQPLLEQAGPNSDADCVLCTSADGFTLTAPLSALTDGRDAMLAIGMNGEILPHRNGFPVRMVVPGLYGYVSATKWVVDLKVSRFADEVAYWTARGWSAEGPIKTASRIDVPRGFSSAAVGEEVVLAGVAWAQHRGIDRVEIQIDEGEWTETTLAPSLSKDTWRQWRTTWTPDSAGQHTVRVRAIDGTGEVQTAEVAPPIPNGASGYDTRSITVN